MDMEGLKNQLLSLSLLTSEGSDVYIQRLEEDLKKNTQQQKKISEEREEVKNLEELVDSLSEYPQKSVLLKVNPVCTLPVTLVHTGEYKIKVGPNTFVLQSSKGTKNYLQTKLKCLSEHLEACKVQQSELERRLDFTLSNRPGEEEMLELAGMPNEIVSEKGVAVKVGTGYEILEFEEEPTVTPRQRRMKREKGVDFDAFARLDELEKQEDVFHELEEN